MIENAGIILAAGRGSRMKELTANSPKCLIELGGRPLLHWQVDAMHAAAIRSILVVCGYASECLRGDFETVYNPRWASTNMLVSLLCAKNFALNFFAGGGHKLLVSYSDIVWRPEHAKKLLLHPGEIAIAYDTLWEKLWRLRFDDPLADAETFAQKNGVLVEIGGKTSDISLIEGQYMGLLSFNEKGWQILLEAAHELGDAVSNTDMTGFLRFLLAKGIAVGTVPVEGGWCEADNSSDIQKYKEALTSMEWSHDWR